MLPASQAIMPSSRSAPQRTTVHVPAGAQHAHPRPRLAAC